MSRMGLRRNFKLLLLTTLLALIVAGGLIAASQLSALQQQSLAGSPAATGEPAPGAEGAGSSTGTTAETGTPRPTTSEGSEEGTGATSTSTSTSTTTITGQPMLGDPNAPVTVIEFADFQCPFCSAVAGDSPQVISYLQSRYPGWEPFLPNLEPYIERGQVKLIFYNFAILGQESIWAAEAALCAFEQDRFWDYYHKLYSNQRGENKGAFVKENLKKFAAQLGLDMERFSACLDSDKYASRVAEEKAEILRMIEELPEEERPQGIGTPGFFINGKLVMGARSWSYFKGLIEAALKEAQGD